MTDRTPEHARFRDRRPHAGIRFKKSLDDDDARGRGKPRRRSRDDDDRFNWRLSLDSDQYDD